MEFSLFGTILKYAVDSNSRVQLGAIFGAELAERSWDYSSWSSLRRRVQNYILDLPVAADRRTLAARQRFCQEVQSRINSPVALRQLASVQGELLTLLVGNDLASPLSMRLQCECIDLPNYQRWTKDCGPRTGFFAGVAPPEEQYDFSLFHRNLQAIVRSWPVLDGMCIALSYLKLSASESFSSGSLFNTLVQKTCNPDVDRAEVITWLSSSGQIRLAPMHDAIHCRVLPWAMLALFAESLEKQRHGYSNHREVAWGMLSEVVGRVATESAGLDKLEDCFRRLSVPRTLLKRFKR